MHLALVVRGSLTFLFLRCASTLCFLVFSLGLKAFFGPTFSSLYNSVKAYLAPPKQFCRWLP